MEQVYLRLQRKCHKHGIVFILSFLSLFLFTWGGDLFTLVLVSYLWLYINQHIWKGKQRWSQWNKIDLIDRLVEFTKAHLAIVSFFHKSRINSVLFDHYLQHHLNNSKMHTLILSTWFKTWIDHSLFMRVHPFIQSIQWLFISTHGSAVAPKTLCLWNKVEFPSITLYKWPTATLCWPTTLSHKYIS